MPGPLAPQEVSASLRQLQGWSAEANNEISRAFRFADHNEAMGFVVRVALAAEAMNHHPDLRIVYNRVEIKLSTHDAGGVTEKDLELARKIDSYV